MASLSELLNEKIGKHGKSKASVADHLGISERTVENYMKGTREPELKDIVKLSLFLGFSLNDLYEQNVPRGTLNESEAARKIKKPDESGHTEKYIAVLEKAVNLAEMVQQLSTRYDQLQSKIEEGLINQAQMQSFLLQISHHVGMKKQRHKQEFRKSDKKTDKTP